MEADEKSAGCTILVHLMYEVRKGLQVSAGFAGVCLGPAAVPMTCCPARQHPNESAAVGQQQAAAAAVAHGLLQPVGLADRLTVAALQS